MTRIVSGKWRGRRLVTPQDSAVRPTAERVREAWLSILSPELGGARMLDLCAGSGALGLEALSRGAGSVTFVDHHARSIEAIRANVATLAADDACTIVREDALKFVAEIPPGRFDLAVADPPFATDLAHRLAERWRAVPFAPLVGIEHDPKVVLNGGETRRWGDIAVTFFRSL